MTTIQEAIQRVPERLEDRLAADALGDLAGYNEDGELRGRIGKATISEESLWVAADQSCALTSEGVYWLRSKRMPDRPPAAPPSGNAIVVLKGRLSPEYDIISVGRCALSPICKPIRLPLRRHARRPLSGSPRAILARLFRGRRGGDRDSHRQPA
jgi:hypothetical protein